MDPLSVAASAAALCQGLRLLTTGIQRLTAALRRAPAEICDLHNELTTLACYLELASSTLSSLSGSPVPLSPMGLDHIHTILLRVQTATQELQQIADGVPVLAAGSSASVSKRRKSQLKWMFETDKITRCRDRIRREREHLADAFRILQQSQGMMQTALILDLRQLLSQASTQRVAERLDSTGEILAEIPAGTANSSSAGTSFPARELYLSKSSCSFHQIPVRQRCSGYCKCRCHVRSAVATPNAATNLIGRLCIRYANIVGPWTGSSSCDYPPCRSSGRRPSSIQLDLLFPTWLLRRSLSISTYWDFVSGISMHLNLPRTIPSNHDIWWFIYHGNLRGVQRLINHIEVHPTDRQETGISMLLFAVVQRQWAVADFLLSLGCNVEETDQYGRSPVSEAMWLTVVDGNHPVKCPEKTVVCTKLLISSPSQAEMIYPSLLHEVIVGKRHMELWEAFTIEPWALAARDLYGATPLHWAVIQRDIEAVRGLISLGADVNSRATQGITPLHWAVLRENIPCAVALLDAGADVDAENEFGHTPLIHAMHNAYYDMVKILLSRGARPSFLGSSGLGAGGYFTSTSWQDEEVTTKCWECLAEHGADINAPAGHNYTLVHSSIYHNHSSAFRMFHRLGARIDAVLPCGETILHLAAKRATSRLFRAMRDAHISNLPSPHMLDEDGYTPMELMNQRVARPEEESGPGVVKPSEEDIAEFKALLEEAEMRYQQQQVG